MEDLKCIIRLLVEEEPLDQIYHDHPLMCDYKDMRECQIEPYRLPIYQVNKRAGTITFERTGDHDDMFE